MNKMKVSYFNNVNDTKPKQIKLKKWLKQTIKPSIEQGTMVRRYREIRSKNLKRQIPCVTISATFSKVRNLENIKHKNPVICLDIDKDDNPVADMEKVKQLLSNHPSTLYVGYSVSNNGIYAIIKINPKKTLLAYFEFFKKRLKAVGIIIDEHCKDYTRLRFFSVDSEAYYNPNAVEFNLPKKQKIQVSSGAASMTDQKKVEDIISDIEYKNIDITQNYADWVKIAGALYSAFGENGRDYFHRVSKFHSDYKPRKCNRKFDQCQNMNKIGLSSFFYVANYYGIRY